jgi:hypothetical protein
MAEKTTEKRKMVSAVDFVRAYVTAGTMDELTKTLGMGRGQVQYRAAGLRKRGVNLPKDKFPTDRKANKLDIDGLNALIETAKTPTTTQTQKKGKAK